MSTFKVGDIVRCFGIDGVVTEVDKGLGYSVNVILDGGKTTSFTPDGRYLFWHKEPSLILISRPKQMVKKTMYQAVVKAGTTPSGMRLSSELYVSKEQARKGWKADHLIALGPAIEIEVEE